MTYDAGTPATRCRRLLPTHFETCSNWRFDDRRLPAGLDIASPARPPYSTVQAALRALLPLWRVALRSSRGAPESSTSRGQGIEAQAGDALGPTQQGRRPEFSVRHPFLPLDDLASRSAPGSSARAQGIRSRPGLARALEACRR